MNIYGIRHSLTLKGLLISLSIFPEVSISLSVQVNEHSILNAELQRE